MGVIECDAPVMGLAPMVDRLAHLDALGIAVGPRRLAELSCALLSSLTYSLIIEVGFDVGEPIDQLGVNHHGLGR